VQPALLPATGQGLSLAGRGSAQYSRCPFAAGCDHLVGEPRSLAPAPSPTAIWTRPLGSRRSGSIAQGRDITRLQHAHSRRAVRGFDDGIALLVIQQAIAVSGPDRVWHSPCRRIPARAFPIRQSVASQIATRLERDSRCALRDARAAAAIWANATISWQFRLCDKPKLFDPKTTF
jgi:hypothetical protein